MRTKRTVAVGLACGLVCAVSVLWYMQSVQAEAQRERDAALARYGGDQVEVCVASRDLSGGEILTADAVVTRSWLVDFLPEGAVSSLDEVVGKRLSSSILEGEPISSKRFDDGEGALNVPEGTVALSLPTTPSSSAGGRTAPGSRVDVYATGDSGTSLLVADALVLESSSQTSSTPGSSWVTVAVSPDRVQELIDASQRTELSFTLPGVGEESGE